MLCFAAVLAVFAAGCNLSGQQPAESSSDAAYSRAVGFLNSAQLVKAREAFADLLRRDPYYFFAYDVYWDTIARTQDERARRLQAAHDLNFLESVPRKERTEDFYLVYEYALKLTGQSDRATLAHQERIERYPKGLAAQSEILDAARAEADPVKSVAMFRDYIRRFPDNVSWTEVAAHEIFFAMTQNAKRFAPAEILAAAGDWERHEAAFLKKFGQPARYLRCLEIIADGITPYDPEKALEYCQKGEAFAEAQWPETTEIADDSRRDFWPILLRGYVALQRWPPALRLGATLEAFLTLIPFSARRGARPNKPRRAPPIRPPWKPPATPKRRAGNLGLQRLSIPAGNPAWTRSTNAIRFRGRCWPPRARTGAKPPLR